MAVHTPPRHVVDLEIVVCPNCGSTANQPVATGPDYDNHCCGNQMFTFVRCQACQERREQEQGREREVAQRRGSVSLSSA